MAKCGKVKSTRCRRYRLQMGSDDVLIRAETGGVYLVLAEDHRIGAFWSWRKLWAYSMPELKLQLHKAIGDGNKCKVCGRD